jgi:hypothetical protein
MSHQYLNIPSYVSLLTPPSRTASKRRGRTLTKRGGRKLPKYAKAALASDANSEGYLYVDLV